MTGKKKSANAPDPDRTELYEREMKHEEHRETPLETAGREAGEAEERRRERERDRQEEQEEEEKA